MPRFFVDKSAINSNIIVLTGENASHIAQVLRLDAGDKITVCDGGQNDYHCKINKVIKEKAQYEIWAEIEETSQNKAEPVTKITLFQGLPKADKMELIIQKAVELGVHEIVPVVTDRTIVKWDKKSGEKTARFQRIAESAAKQSGRGIVPKIAEIAGLAECITHAGSLDKSIVAYESEKAFTLKAFLNGFSGASLGIFIGPEGGFSEEEIAKLNSAGILSITLGNRILRTETAGFMALAIMLYHLEG